MACCPPAVSFSILFSYHLALAASLDHLSGVSGVCFISCMLVDGPVGQALQLRFSPLAPGGPRTAERVIVTNKFTVTAISFHCSLYLFWASFSWPAYKKQAVGPLWGHIPWGLVRKKAFKPQTCLFFLPLPSHVCTSFLRLPLEEIYP